MDTNCRDSKEAVRFLRDKACASAHDCMSEDAEPADMDRACS